MSFSYSIKFLSCEYTIKLMFVLLKYCCRIQLLKTHSLLQPISVISCVMVCLTKHGCIEWSIHQLPSWHCLLQFCMASSIFQLLHQWLHKSYFPQTVEAIDQITSRSDSTPDSRYNLHLLHWGQVSDRKHLLSTRNWLVKLLTRGDYGWTYNSSNNSFWPHLDCFEVIFHFIKAWLISWTT